MFVRDNERCPAEAFLETCERGMLNKFAGQFQALRVMGAEYEQYQRFRALHGEGRPLWEFKQHDHRLYCAREVSGMSVVVVLFNGWVKDKAGKSDEERREIARALGLYGEYMTGVVRKGTKPC